MTQLLTYLAAIPVIIWTYLLRARGGFWQVSKHVPSPQPLPDTSKSVIAVIPARNEAEVIGDAITSLIKQDYRAVQLIVLVDDASTDGTAEVAKLAAGNLVIIPAQPLIPGWTGKLWALSQGVAYAATLEPDYLLLTDADIRHGHESVSNLVAIAKAGNYDVASFMVKLACRTTAEKALIPAFVFFFLKLYPPAWIRSSRFRTAGAADGCILIRTDTLRKIGGLAAIRAEVIDDCALARAVKRAGGRVWMGLTPDTESMRSYGSFAEIGRMISRTAFSQLHHSALLLIGTVAGLFLTYLSPPLLLLSRRRTPRACGGTAWLLMSVAYLPMVRFYKRSVFWSLSLPAVALFYAGATVHSAIQYWRGRGGAWKGRVQDRRLS